MKTKQLLKFILLGTLLSSCTALQIDTDSSSKEVNESSESLLESEESSLSIEESSIDEETLNNAKKAAIEEISNFVSLTKYREAEQEIIQNYIDQAIKIINNCKTIEDINYFLELYEGYIMEVKTDAQYKKEALDKCVTTEQITEYQNKGYNNLYKDPNYKKGYIVTKPTYGAGESPYHDEYMSPYKPNGTPIWTIAQWTSRYDLMGKGTNDGYTLTSDIDGVVNTFTSKGKTVDGKFVPGKVITANSKTGELYLECNTSVEYDTPRKGDEGWVHLLYSQDFGDNLVNVSKCSSIVMEAEFTVNKCENHTGSAYDTSKHAAQLVWYITLQNRTGGYSNPDFGKYIWFGIGLWDNRSEGRVTNMYRAHDAGTDTLIYNPSSSDFFKNDGGKQPKIGVKALANIDIRPIAETAYNYAKEHGYLGNTKFEDLYIGGTNFGYEIPGTFDISSTIHKINVFYK